MQPPQWRNRPRPSAAIGKENLCSLFTLGIAKPRARDPGMVALAHPRIIELFGLGLGRIHLLKLPQFF